MDAHLWRLAECGKRMRRDRVNNFEVLLLVKPANMFYFTGNSRLCSYVLITKTGAAAMGVPVTDLADVRETTHFDHIKTFDDEMGMIHSLGEYFNQFEITKGSVGMEYSYLSKSMIDMFSHPHAKPESVEVRDCTQLVSALRIVKEPGEVELMRSAAHVADTGMAAAVESLKPGVTESQVAAAAEYAMRQAGAEDFWRTYVSSGPRTNVAHGVPTQRTIEKNDLVMIDIHPIVAGYSADICRTVCAGEPSEEQLAAYDVYLGAQQETIAQVRQGAGVADLEQKIHALMAEAGHGKHIFGPPIHGVGIEFEEAPLPPGHAFFHGEEAPAPLKANTVLAVGNCGLYTGPWGVRIEDTVVVGAEGPEVLTGYTRALSQA